MNFDPDTAGAKATERTLGLLVEEEFQIKVLTLEQGFDPDLYIRRKGKEAYGEALRNSQRYFDYLIERARAQFPVRSAEGKLEGGQLPACRTFSAFPAASSATNSPHEIAQKLRHRFLRPAPGTSQHTAATRSAATVKAPAEAQVTDAEKVLIRALASARQIQPNAEHISERDGAEEEFDPARQAHFVLQNERLHRGSCHRIPRSRACLMPGPKLPMYCRFRQRRVDRRMLASILDERGRRPYGRDAGSRRARPAAHSPRAGWSRCNASCKSPGRGQEGSA